jgi:hypothetical protein
MQIWKGCGKAGASCRREQGNDISGTESSKRQNAQRLESLTRNQEMAYRESSTLSKQSLNSDQVRRSRSRNDSRAIHAMTWDQHLLTESLNHNFFYKAQ